MARESERVDRRPCILRDIQDVHAILQQAENRVPETRIAAETLERLRAEELEYSEVCTYLLGRDVAKRSRTRAWSQNWSRSRKPRMVAGSTLARIESAYWAWNESSIAGVSARL